MTHVEIRRALLSGCSEAAMKAMRCPVCKGEVGFFVHPRGKGFVIRCVAASTHMHMSDTNDSPPEWWRGYVEQGGWMA